MQVAAGRNGSKELGPESAEPLTDSAFFDITGMRVRVSGFMVP